MPELAGHFVTANSLQNMCYVSRRIPDTSTFRAEDDPELLRSSDRWFRPVDIKTGPDGCIYLADWYDTRLSHVRPIDDWSKEDGRIYRVRPKDAKVGLKPFNLHTAPVSDLDRELEASEQVVPPAVRARACVARGEGRAAGTGEARARSEQSECARRALRPAHARRPER